MKIENGKAQPFTNEEKIIIALQEAVAENFLSEGVIAWVRSFSVRTFEETPASGGVLYKAEGDVTIGVRRISDGVILLDQKHTFDISFSDSKDSWGLPCVKVLSKVFVSNK